MAAAAPAASVTAECWCHACEARVQAERDATGELRCSVCHQSYVEETSDAAQSSGSAAASTSAAPSPAPHFLPQAAIAPPVAMVSPFLPFLPSGFPFRMPVFPFPGFPGSAPPDVFFSTPGDYALSGQHFVSIVDSLLTTGAAAGSPAPEHRPTPEAVLQAMQRRVAQEADSSGGSQAECVICQSGVAAGDELLTLSECRHQFHTGCIEPWLRQHSICPTCRRPVYVFAAAT